MTADPVGADRVRASVHIDAPPERVWEYFTRPDAIVQWMGEYALLEPEPGGRSAAVSCGSTRRAGS